MPQLTCYGFVAMVTRARAQTCPRSPCLYTPEPRKCTEVGLLVFCCSLKLFCTHYSLGFIRLYREFSGYFIVLSLFCGSISCVCNHQADSAMLSSCPSGPGRVSPPTVPCLPCSVSLFLSFSPLCSPSALKSTESQPFPRSLLTGVQYWDNNQR